MSDKVQHAGEFEGAQRAQKRFTTVERRRIEAWVASGRSWYSMGKELGRLPGSVRKFAQYHGIARPEPTKMGGATIVQDRRDMFGFVEPPRKFRDDPDARFAAAIGDQMFEDVRLSRPNKSFTYRVW